MPLVLHSGRLVGSTTACGVTPGGKCGWGAVVGDAPTPHAPVTGVGSMKAMGRLKLEDRVMILPSAATAVRLEGRVSLVETDPPSVAVVALLAATAVSPVLSPVVFGTLTVLPSGGVPTKTGVLRLTADESLTVPSGGLDVDSVIVTSPFVTISPSEGRDDVAEIVLLLSGVVSPLSDEAAHLSDLASLLSDVVPLLSEVISHLSGVVSLLSNIFSFLSAEVVSHFSKVVSLFSEVVSHLSAEMSLLAVVISLSAVVVSQLVGKVLHSAGVVSFVDIVVSLFAGVLSD